MVLDAHRQRVDKDRQKDALLEVLVVNEALDVLPNEVEYFRHNFVAGDARAVWPRVLVLELFVGQVQLLLVIFLSGVVEILLVQLKTARVVLELGKFVIVIVIVAVVVVVPSQRRVKRVECRLPGR